MGLFFYKKSEAPKPACSCSGGCSTPAESGDTGRMVKVLGGGCAKCNQLEEAAKAAMIELGLTPEVDHITDFSQIAAYGVMTTPALVVNSKVVCYGRVPGKDEVKDLIRKGME